MAFTRHRVHNTLDPARVKTDGTSSRDQDPHEERLRARVTKNSAYDKYKASLHEFFDGGKPLPDNLRALLATRPGADTHLGVTEEERAEAEAEAKAAAEPAPTTKTKKKKGPVQKDRGDEPRRTRHIAPAGGDDYKGLVESIRKASSPREVEGAIDALKAAGYVLPTTASCSRRPSATRTRPSSARRFAACSRSRRRAASSPRASCARASTTWRCWRRRRSAGSCARI